LIIPKKEVSDNFYWLSTVPDVPDWGASTWYNTPCSSYADLTLLQTLPSVNLNVNTTHQYDKVTKEFRTNVKITNENQNVVAFFIRVAITGLDGKEVWPIFWDDNYFSLLPGDSKTTSALYFVDSGFQPQVKVSVFNNNK